MWIDTKNQLHLPSADLKEQLQGLTSGWTSGLSDHARHRALWRLRLARRHRQMAVPFRASGDPGANDNCMPTRPRTTTVRRGRSPVRDQRMVFHPVVERTRSPAPRSKYVFLEIQDATEHWEATSTVLHSHQFDPLLEPGLAHDGKSGDTGETTCQKYVRASFRRCGAWWTTTTTRWSLGLRRNLSNLTSGRRTEYAKDARRCQCRPYGALPHV